MIRINPFQVKEQAGSIDNIAAELQRINKEILQTVQSAPSYNGEFGPKVKSIGASLYAIGTQRSADLNVRSKDLTTRADKFDKTDKKPIVAKSIISIISGIINANKVVADIINGLLTGINKKKKATSSANENKSTKTNTAASIKASTQTDPFPDRSFMDDVEQQRKEKRKAAIKKGVPEEFWVEWYKYGCPRVGSDAYLAFLGECYTSQNHPVAILKNGNEYCVYIRGTDGDPLAAWDTKGKENNWLNTIAAFEGQQTGYEKQVLDLIYEKIPKGAKIHLVGHSQGGIIANNCVADLLENFKVASITTFGSPPPLNYQLPKSIKTKYYGDTDDYVSKLTNYYLGALAIKNPDKADQLEKIRQKKNNQLTIVDNSGDYRFDMPFNIGDFKANVANGIINGAEFMESHKLKNYISADACRNVDSSFNSNTKSSGYEFIEKSKNSEYQAKKTKTEGDKTLENNHDFMKVKEIDGFRSDDIILNFICSQIESTYH